MGSRPPTVTWIITTLQTATSKHRDLQQISIHPPHIFALISAGANVGQIIGVVHRQRLDLDHLVQFSGSRSIRLKVIHTARKTGERN